MRSTPAKTTKTLVLLRGTSTGVTAPENWGMLGEDLYSHYMGEGWDALWDCRLGL